jgi:hypothetical protein
MANIGTRFTYNSVLLLNRNPTTTVRVGESGAVHLIEVKNHSRVDYTVDIVGNLGGGWMQYANGTTTWPLNGVLVPAADQASPTQGLTISGPAGPASLRCDQFTYRLAGAPGTGTTINQSASVSVQVTP